MSIASEITRLQGVKSDILTAIADKGVTVPADSMLDDCPDLIASIPTGGGNIPDGYRLTMYTEIHNAVGGLAEIMPKYQNLDDIIPYRFDTLEYQVYLKGNGDQTFGFSGQDVEQTLKYLKLSVTTTAGSESMKCKFQFRGYLGKTLTISGAAEGLVVAKMSYDGTAAHYALNDITYSENGALSNDALSRNNTWELFNVTASMFEGTKIFRMRSKIYNSDQYRFDYVPARRISDNRAGFINLVTGNFVYAGIPANLIPGPDIT